MTEWHEYPSLLLQLNALSKTRDDLREHNLYESYGMRPSDDLGQPTDEVRRARQPDGTWDDLEDPHMGAKGTGFGRNVPLSMTVTASPSVISAQLTLVPVTMCTWSFTWMMFMRGAFRRRTGIRG